MPRFSRYRELIKTLGESKITLPEILEPEACYKNKIINDMMCNSELSYDELVVLRQYAEAIVNGSTKAAEFIRDTAGEKPATAVDISDERQSGIKQLSDEELKKYIDALSSPISLTDIPTPLTPTHTEITTDV